MSKGNSPVWLRAMVIQSLTLVVRIFRFGKGSRRKKEDLRYVYITPGYASGKRLEFLVRHFERQEAQRQKIARPEPVADGGGRLLSAGRLAHLHPGFSATRTRLADDSFGS